MKFTKVKKLWGRGDCYYLGAFKKYKKKSHKILGGYKMRYRVVLEEQKKNEVEVKTVTCHVGVKGNIEEYANYFSYDNKSAVLSIYK